MKQLKIAGIVFLGLLMIYLCAGLWISLSTGAGFTHQARSQANYSLVMEKEVEAEGIRSLQIDYGMNSNDIRIRQWDGDNILIREYMNFEPDDRDLSAVEQGDGQLWIKGKRRNSFFFFSLFTMSSKDAYTEVYLPAGFAERLHELEAKTVSGEISSEISFAGQERVYLSTTSGDIFFPGVSAEKIRVSTTSGNVHLTSVSGDLTVSTVSGDILADQVSSSSLSTTSGNIRIGEVTGDINAETTSGDIRIEKLTGDIDADTTSGEIRLGKTDGDVSVNTTSGDIRVEDLTGIFRLGSTSGEIFIEGKSVNGTARTVSGDIRVFTDGLSGDLKMSTTSGSVSLELPETSSFALDFDSTSGECNTFFDDRLSFSKKGNKAKGEYGGGEHSVTISTTSGDLRITRRDNK